MATNNNETIDFFAEAKKWKDDNLASSFPYFLPSSNPDSPVESVTESDLDEEEDYMARLTRRMAHSFLYDDDDEPIDDTVKPKTLGGAVSPQSTLCPDWPAPEKKEEIEYHQSELNPRLLQAVNFQLMYQHQKKRAESFFYKKTAAAAADYNRLQTAQLALPGVWAGQSKARNYCALGVPSSAWPPLPLQQQSIPLQRRHSQQPMVVRSGMRTVFLNGPGIKKESAGTGVFLPRIAGSKTEALPRRKPACSPVLVPARVVQALNLNLEQLGAHPRFTNAGAYAEYILNQEMVLRGHSGFSAYQKSPRGHLRSQTPVGATGDANFLPHEWTY